MQTNSFASLSRKNRNSPLSPRPGSVHTLRAFRLVDVSVDDKRDEVNVTLYSIGQAVTARCSDPTVIAHKGKVIRAAVEGREQPRLTAWQAPEPDATFPALHVPNPAWLPDQQLYRDFVAMIDGLRPVLRDVVHQVLSLDDDLRRFVSAGASMYQHHSHEGGLLEHTVDCMRFVSMLASAMGDGVDRDLVLAGAALHDVGKCREYVRNGNRTELSDEGELSGHKLVGLTMLSAALSRTSMAVDEQQALIHCITAVSGAPDYVGLREPRMVEALLVGACDGLSARTAPMLAAARGKKGWSKMRFGRQRNVFSVAR